MSNELERIKKLFKSLMREKNKPFPKMGERLDVPTDEGVYAIYDAKGIVLHVGKTSGGSKGLRQRLNNHLQNQSSFTKKHLSGNGHKLRGKYLFKFVIVDDPRLRTLLEAYAISHLCPRHLGVGKKRKYVIPAPVSK